MPLKHVTLALNNLDPSTWERYETDDVLKLIKEKLPVFPDTARIYYMAVSHKTDITPNAGTLEKDIAHIQSLPGPFFVVVYPGIQALPYIIAVVLAVAAYVFAPGVPTPARPPPATLARNSQAPSPNNELSDRSNRARINGRIPDIYGTVRSTPDLIAAPYKIFENNREVEFSYMCIGRGPYTVTDIRDGETQAAKIPGTSVMVYAPYTSPNQYDPNVPASGDPELTIGELRHERVVSSRRSNSVNGQVLRPPNEVTYAISTGQTQVLFRYPNRVEAPSGSGQDFTKFFVEGDEITITGALMDGSPITINLSFYAITGNLVFNYPGGTKTFNFNDGCLVFPPSMAETLAAVFAAGTFSITTQSVTSIGDISGTYTVAGTPGVVGPDNAAQQAAGIPSYYVVQLVSPELVTPDWNNIPNSFITYRSDFEYDSSPFDIDLNGVYIINSVTKELLVLDNPNATAPDWEDVLSIELVTPFLDAAITSNGSKWVGPFILEDSKLSEIYANFVASNGLYKDGGLLQEAGQVTVEIEVTPVDLLDEPLGDPEIFTETLNGSTFLKETVAVTLKAKPTFFGRTSIRARRITEADDEFDGQVVDEVRWRDVYSIAPVDKTDFGNVTTVFSITLATASALAVKERKLNMLVQRKIPTYEGGTLTDTLEVSDDVPVILAAICRDKYLGNRTIAELDLANWFETADEVETYFGTTVARKFSYTFDKDNVSFEEMVSTVAQAMFCIAYRRGSVIKLSFEKLTNDSTLLFNHRNKIPGTEQRSITFGGFSGDNDGVEYTYVDPHDDSINTIFLPEEFAAVNPKRIESIGIRDHLQAYFHVWRIWNRIQFQNTIVEFDATQEADLLVVNERILVTDGTRPFVQEGEVYEADGTELTLSQEVELVADPPYTIFLQHYDGTVESIPITAGSETNKVVLDDAPLLPLSVDPRNYARTTYLITGANDVTQTAFLVSEKSPGDRVFVSTVKAVNYDAGYYANDLDFINEVVDENGYAETGGYTPPETGDTGYLPPETTSFSTAAQNAFGVGSSIGGFLVATAGAQWDFGTGTDWTVEFWLRVDSDTADNLNEVIHLNDGENDIFWKVRYDTNLAGTVNSIRVDFNSEGIEVVNSISISVPVGEWFHVAVVFKRSENLVIYLVNGADLGDDTFGAVAALSVSSLEQIGTIGKSANCTIDDLRVWDVARTQSQIASNLGAPLANPTGEANLVAYWTFDEEDLSPGSFLDHSSYGTSDAFADLGTLVPGPP